MLVVIALSSATGGRFSLPNGAIHHALAKRTQSMQSDTCW
jgi:hypothetical protein